jgi:ribosomal protein S18 acetylase RimI-like enzyme
MKIEFIRATAEDTDELVEVQNKSFYSDYIRYGECPGYNHSKAEMEDIVQKRVAYKILCDGQVVGDILVRDNGDHTYFLGCLCVIPEYENMGIGQKAIQYLETEFSDAVLWTLETPADKYRNHYFYKKMGFRIAKESVDGSVKIVLFEKRPDHL